MKPGILYGATVLAAEQRNNTEIRRGLQTEKCKGVLNKFEINPVTARKTVQYTSSVPRIARPGKYTIEVAGRQIQKVTYRNQINCGLRLYSSRASNLQTHTCSKTSKSNEWLMTKPLQNFSLQKQGCIQMSQSSSAGELQTLAIKYHQ